jgi:hypothetical protein
MAWTELDSGVADNVTVPSLSVLDSTFSVKDQTDVTKVVQFDVGTNVPTATTVTLTAPAASGSLTTNAGTQTLTNKTLNLTSNTLTGTLAQFNTALSDDNFASLTGAETLTNKTLTAPAINTPTITNLVLGSGGTTLTKYLSATMTYDAPSVADNAVTTQDVTVTGAAVGDLALASLTTILGNSVLLFADVRAADTVRVVLLNKSGGNLDLSSGTLRVGVFKH